MTKKRNLLTCATFCLAMVTVAAGCVEALEEDGLAFEEDEAAPADKPTIDDGDIAPKCHRYGMTWQRGGRTVDVEYVGTDASTNTYSGDTSCQTSLPILCVRKSGLPKPWYITTYSNKGWIGGHIALTRGHVGYDMSSAAVADSICASELGAGWEMAEFHDGGGISSGWSWQAYGAATTPERFWVMINDQPANCWNSTCR